MLRNELEDYTGRLLEIDRFRDYCPNGLQVEGKIEIRRIATGVTASLAFLEKAREAGADAAFVHHGYFWKNEDPRIAGIKKKRIGLLLESGMNLFAYHLPLDAHPELGNNAQLSKILGFEAESRFGEQGIAMLGKAGDPLPAGALAEKIGMRLDREALLVGNPSRPVKTIAWCSGAAQGYLLEAARLGADAYLSGEISEQTVHEAEESGIAYICAGHYATERYGIQALGKHLAETFGIESIHIDTNNPI